MAITISTHNGSAVRRAHNIRDRRVVEKQEHIDPDGRHETWRDFPEREAYKIFFGDAVADYNERQTRPERRIDDLWDKVHADAKQHTCYELIATVGRKGNTVDADTAADILHRYVDGWDERNPNLAMIGAYFHADEEGAPHVHIDYVPIANGYKRGPEIQPGLVKALGEQGFRKRKNSTPQIDWEHSENRALEQICAAHGIEVEHPQAGHGAKHVHTEQYKAERDLAETNRELYLARGDLAAVDEKLAETRQMLHTASKECAVVNDSIKLKKAEREALNAFFDDVKVATNDDCHDESELANRVKVTRNGDIKVIFTEDEWEKLHYTAVRAENALNGLISFRDQLPTEQEYEQMQSEIKRLKKENAQLEYSLERLKETLDDTKTQMHTNIRALKEESDFWNHLAVNEWFTLRGCKSAPDKVVEYGLRIGERDSRFKWKPEDDIESFRSAVQNENSTRTSRRSIRQERDGMGMDF